MRFNVDDLIEKDLVYAKVSPCKNYRLFRYKKKVFNDNLWCIDSRLLQCRGIVADKDDNVVMYPFDKVFNLGENGAGEDIPDDKEVIAVRKVNGYLAQAGVVDGELIITSSGSFDSENAVIAKKMIEDCISPTTEPFKPFAKLLSGYTYMFEICHKGDPHIVEEKEGVYLIGVRNHSNYRMYSPSTIQLVAYLHNFKCPEFITTTFSEAVGMAKTANHEGYMIVSWSHENTILVKVKSHYYLCKKALMRIGSAQLDVMFDNPKAFKEHRLEEEFYGIHQYILDNYTKDEYRSLTEQQRRKLIEDYFNDNNL